MSILPKHNSNQPLNIKENEMTTTEQMETFKVNLQTSAKNIRRGLNGRVLLGTLAVLSALFVIGMLPRWRANAALTSSVRDQRPTVSVISPQRPDDNANVVLPGGTQAIQETAIYARTNGYVRRWLADIGAKVEAGQLLAEIETPEVDQELNQARANVAQASANADLARATLSRWQELVEKKVVSSQEFDEKKAAADARNADLNVAQANMKRLEELQGFEKIVAPFTGIVTARNIDNGILVSAGSNAQGAPLFRVAQTDTLRIYVTVPQAQARSIVAGQNATVSLREIPDKTFNAKVVRTAGALDPASRTLLTELQLPNRDGQLFPGMYAEVKFALPHDERTLLIPGNAVTVQSDGPKVLVVDAKQTIRTRQVKLGRDLGDKVEILSGLDPAEPLVANPSGALREGAEVKVQSQPSKKS
jgi:membrane fusion protein (multidrug efflux system)